MSLVADNIGKLQDRKGNLPAPVVDQLKQLNALLSEENYRKFFPDSPSSKRTWDYAPLDTAKIRLGVRIFGSLQINGKIFIPNGLDMVDISKRFPELRDGTQAYRFVSELLRIEKRYSDWIRFYGFALGYERVPPLSSEAREEALRGLFPKYQVIYCSGTMCGQALTPNGAARSREISDALTAEARARGVEKITAVVPGGCMRACGSIPISLITIDEKGNGELQNLGYLSFFQGTDPDKVRQMFKDKWIVDTHPTNYEMPPASSEALIQESLCRSIREQTK